MKIAEKKRVLDVLNSLDVIETNGGEEAYILVENNKENHELLNDVGVPSETINGFGDEETFCILSLAFSEGYADLYDGNKIIAFDRKMEVEVSKGEDIILYKHNGGVYLALSKDDGSVAAMKLSGEQINQIKTVTAQFE